MLLHVQALKQINLRSQFFETSVTHFYINIVCA